MSDTPWTKGPWEIIETGGFRNASGLRVEHSSCWIEGAWGGKDARASSRANDRLISAAPDMAGALQAILDDVEPTEFALASHVRERARAALAKARGTQ